MNDIDRTLECLTDNETDIIQHNICDIYEAAEIMQNIHRTIVGNSSTCYFNLNHIQNMIHVIETLIKDTDRTILDAYFRQYKARHEAQEETEGKTKAEMTE